MSSGSLEPSRVDPELSRRTWRQWWLTVPGWLRIAIWSVVISVAVQIVAVVAIAIRIHYGLIEPPELVEFRKLGVNVAFDSDRRGEPFRGFNRMLDGIKGRSCDDVVSLRIDFRANDDVLGQVAVLFKNIEGLYLENSDITGRGLSALSRCTKLFALDLSDTDLDDSDVEVLSSFLKVSNLDLQGTLITDASIAVLEKFPQLREVNLARTDVTLDAIKSWRTRFPGMRILTDRDHQSDIVVGTVVWSDGQRSRRFPGKFRVSTHRPNGSGHSGYMSSGLTASFPGLQWSPQSFRDGDGKYVLICQLGPYESDPVELEVVDSKASTNTVEFRMPVTKDEALKADRDDSSKPH